MNLTHSLTHSLTQLVKAARRRSGGISQQPNGLAAIQSFRTSFFQDHPKIVPNTPAPRMGTVDDRKKTGVQLENSKDALNFRQGLDAATRIIGTLRLKSFSVTPFASSETRIRQLTITEQGEEDEGKKNITRSRGGSSCVMCSVAAAATRVARRRRRRRRRRHHHHRHGQLQR